MRVIGYHVSSKGIIVNSDGEKCTEPPYFDFLLEDKPESIRIFYNLNQAMPALAKLTKFSLDECIRFSQSRNGNFFASPYKMKYIPNRFLQLQKGFYKNNPYAYFYDAKQYEDTPISDSETIEQCFEKAERAKEIGVLVKESLQELGIEVKSLTSPVSIFNKQVLSKYDLPGDSDVSEEVGEIAYECCEGNWLEAFKIGHWDKAYDYDISSAYPSKAAELFDIRDGNWVESKDYIENAVYGYCRGYVRIFPDVKFSPIMFKDIKRSNTLLEPMMPTTHTPTGIWPKKINKGQIDFIKKWGLGEYTIEKGNWWIPNDNARKPLENLVKYLYMQKENSSGIKKKIIKRVMAGSLYGGFLEVREEVLGKNFLSVWGAEIEVPSRLEVADFVLRNNLNPIHIAVDGVIGDKLVELPETKLGGWKLSHVTPCICVGTGQVAIKDDGKGDFHLTYDYLKNKIEDNPDSSEYYMVKRNPVSISEAANGKYDSLGELEEVKKYIIIGAKEKRYYRDVPKTGGELLKGQFDSIPWDISVISK